MSDLAILILAAGKGTRMRSGRAKVLHEILGEPMLVYPLAAAARLEAARIISVIGHQAEEIRTRLADAPVTFVHQEPQLGSGHAAMVAREALGDFQGRVLVLYGDCPLVQSETLERLLAEHAREGRAITLLGMKPDDPTGYGRVLQDASGAVTAIREERDATPREKEVGLVHSGVMVAESTALWKSLERVRTDNDQGEYYLTDVAEIAAADGLAVGVVEAPDAEELSGINTRAELAQATARLRDRINAGHMTAGVTLEDPPSVRIGPRVRIGVDTVIGPNVTITGITVLGEGCVIETGSVIAHARIGSRVRVKPHCVLREAIVEDDVQIGPLAQLRPGAVLRRGAKVGDFVEIKKSEIGPGSKVNHLAYIGDTTIGARVNVGAGTITCNYDGEKKHRTVIEDDAFIGSDSQFVAPVTVGRGAYVGSGSTITRDVPAGALAVGRGRQRNIEGWVARRKGKREEND
jgi:bifunctional UDP-N-acetylglucosamine pyrophosphorylase/glucosamine-1-phosphate N-acetyltransferase